MAEQIMMASPKAPDPAQVARKPRGWSLHVGIDEVDARHYGSPCRLQSCGLDAVDMSAIADRAGFARRILLNEKATAESVIECIGSIADVARTGDIFFLTYSGHGGQVPDTNGDELDRFDETWCCWNRQLVDDELFDALRDFHDGVRVLVLSDSCHSGTMTRNASVIVPPNARCLPPTQARTIARNNSRLYENIQNTTNPRASVALGTSVILISACLDGEVAIDGPKNGAFTAAVKTVWRNGKFKGDYDDLRTRAGRLLAHQHPNYFALGKFNPTFANQKPFTI